MRKLLLASLLGILFMGFGWGAIGFFYKAPAGSQTVMVEMKELRHAGEHRGPVSDQAAHTGKRSYIEWPKWDM
jgi:hypothetical protein